MNWATITLIILLTMSVTINLSKHGTKGEREYNFWTSLISALLQLWLIYKSGGLR